MIRFLLCSIIIIFVTCQSHDETGDITAENGPATLHPDTSYYRVMVNNLRLRQEPSLESSTLTMLAEGALIRYWGEHSQATVKISLRGKPIESPWYLVKFGNQTGWVFAGALENAEDPKDDLVIIPGQRIGAILAQDNEQAIIARIGPDHVSRRTIHVGEGETVEATIAYPSTEKEL
ncbi:MAG: SH3 domain-containing protein, partial [Saprospiraceae bacterium]|nr:SH3 domain-containing protein [Saprospiraceae bacterium]